MTDVNGGSAELVAYLQTKTQNETNINQWAIGHYIESWKTSNKELKKLSDDD